MKLTQTGGIPETRETTRRVSICEQMRRPVTLLTSREVPDSHPFADVVKLLRDDCALQVSEPTADPIGGTTRDATGPITSCTTVRF